MINTIFFQSLLIYMNFGILFGQNNVNFISKVNVNRSIENRGFHR